MLRRGDGGWDDVKFIADLSEARIAELARSFREAQPFPYLAIDDLMRSQALPAFDPFPSSDDAFWHHFKDRYQHNKRACNDLDRIPSPYRDLLVECSSPAFLDLLEKITGIEDLIPDPYFEGGGLHSSGAGGVLAPHTDFHFYRRLGLYRRLNVLIYFNPGWTEADGGALELYRKGETTPGASVVPVLGRAVVFRTDDQSVHGFTKPVADGKWRNSVALYYYTARDAAGFSGDTTTHWQNRKISGLRRAAFDALIFGSRALSKLAHMVDPNTKRS